VKVIPLFRNRSQLVARAAKQDRRAQRELYEQFSPKMLGVCRMYIRDLQHAEDVMLGAFFKAFSHLSDFQDKGSFEGWLRRIMIRESISFLRAQKQVEFADDLPLEKENSFNDVQSNIDVEHIQQLIDELPEGYRMVFVMYAIEGYKHREIAELLAIDEGTSKSQLFKARKMLQEQLKTIKKTHYATT